MSNQVTCKRTGETLAIKSGGGTCLCKDGECRVHPEMANAPLAGIAIASLNEYRREQSKAKPVATLTLIDSPRFGPVIFGTLDGPVEHIHALSHQMRVTAKHIHMSGCRGPRPDAP